MNVTRIAILGVAAIAAGAAALLVRGMLGGGTPSSQASLPPPPTTVEVLVAAKDIIPGHAVDVVFTRDMSGGNGPKNFQSETILRDVRVLAVDQTAHQEKDQQSVVGKTATLELTPEQAELIARSQPSGILSLALRALGDSSG